MVKKKPNTDDTESESEEEFFESDDDEQPKKKSSPVTSDESSDTKSVTFIKLKDDGKTEIRWIYHISDIHIRNTQRHTEYKEVFERTYKTLETQIGKNTKTSLIVVTGDIMHTKTELSPEAISIAYHFFKKLDKIAPVILIPGNHDCNLSNKNRMDALSPIVDIEDGFSNLHYLKKSGLYQYYNIVFGVTSIFDDKIVSAKKISSEIWKKIKQKNKYRIALYHGPVHGAKTDVGYRMHNEQLVAEDFNGYDYVMLGDIHKFQYMNKDQTIAYAGSLIQQSYGESLKGHGILIWDLLDEESKHVEVKNDYGYCTVRIEDGKVSKTIIPRKPCIRFVVENTNQIQYQEALTSLEKEYQICEIVRESNFRTKMHNASPSQKKLKQEVTAYSTQEGIIKSYLAKKGLDTDKIKSIINLHKKIYQKILSDKKDQVADAMHNSTKTQKWKILELRFSNTLSYGKDNVINFRNYDPNKIIGIVAPNHYGKSAILDIILFCLFDKFSRGDRRDILNKNEKNMYCSLLLAIGSQKYLIERIGQRSRNGLTVKIDVNFYLFKKNTKGKEIKEKLNGIDKNETNKKIVELIGDYNDYLTTCFCLQQGKSSNFIDMTQLQKKEYLNEILKLNVFEDCYELAKDKLKQLTGQLKLLEQKVGMKSLSDIKQSVKKTTADIKKLEAQKQCIELSLSEELTYILESLSQISLTKYHELSEYDLSSEESILKSLNIIRTQLAQKSDIDPLKMEKELIDNKKRLKELEIEDQDRQKSLISAKHDTKSMGLAKEKLIKKLINLPRSERIDIAAIKGEIETHEERIKIITTILADKKEEVLKEKLDRIDELKKKISNLRAKISRAEPAAETVLRQTMTKLSDNQKIIHDSIDKALDSLQILDNAQREKLESYLRMRKSFAKHISMIDGETIKYQYGSSVVNDAVVKAIVNLNKSWRDKYNSWTAAMEKKLSIPKNELDIQSILSESKKLTSTMMDAGLDYFALHDNNTILKEISAAEKELDTLSEFRGTKKEIDNLKQEKKVLEDKIKLCQRSIQAEEEQVSALESNNSIQKEIDTLQEKINKQTAIDKKCSDEITDLRASVEDAGELLTKHKEKLAQTKRLEQHLKLLDEYYLLYIGWSQKNDYLKKWTKIKKQFDEDLGVLSKEIEKKNIELAIQKKDIEQYLDQRKEFDDKSSETNIYQLYVQVMNCNGLPYEMLKTYLPLIESDVNQVLHAMVNFNIEFMFYDEQKLEDQKSKQLKSNMGCVDINICYQNMKPYNVQLVSGFERFIIGLAIRMTLCQISLTAKPNFLIIDEGWSCLDSDNLNNVGSIMSYIKSQYEHIIIISHLQELRGQADYVINIEKINGYSRVIND